MSSFKIGLSVFAALVLGEIAPMFKGVSSEKATGLALIFAGFIESFLSPLFWILAIGSFFFFRWAGRNEHGAVRLLLFWIPSTALLLIGFVFLTLLAYLALHFRSYPSV